MVIRTSLVAAFAFVVAAAANAAESVHLFIKTSAQGQIQGTSTAKGKEKWIELESWSVKSPRDVASGQATGKRQHKPVTFIMHYDRAAMQLLQALVTNENVIECKMVVTDDAGNSKTATFSDIEFGHVTVLKSAETGRPMEEVSFNYSKIEWK